MKKTKPYTNDEEPQNVASEPFTPFGRTANNDNGIMTSLCDHNNSNGTPDQLVDRYEQWKAEADKIYGNNKRMSPEEYFGKLWYVVERAYEHV